MAQVAVTYSHLACAAAEKRRTESVHVRGTTNEGDIYGGGGRQISMCRCRTETDTESDTPTINIYQVSEQPTRRGLRVARL